MRPQSRRLPSSYATDARSPSPCLSMSRDIAMAFVWCGIICCINMRTFASGSCGDGSGSHMKTLLFIWQSIACKHCSNGVSAYRQTLEMSRLSRLQLAIAKRRVVR